ncbi:MAG: hypothetical protein HKN84_09680 [Gammaproteobacteria bacterium]|nr:hypothetical protein [Gammaproteobacteria bacterium]
MNSEPDTAQASACVPSLERLLDLTDVVQEAISAGDWQNAAVAEAERRAMLEAYIEQERGKNGDLAQLSDELAGLQSRSHRLIGELSHHRRRLEHKACELGRGRRAVSAYMDLDEHTAGS